MLLQEIFGKKSITIRLQQLQIYQREEIKRTYRSEILPNWQTMNIISNIVIVKNVLKSFSGYLPDNNSKKMDTRKCSWV